jgi:hypothetical protein
MSEVAGLDEFHAASMCATWTCWLVPLMSITAPQKHLDQPLEKLRAAYYEMEGFEL